MMGMLLTDLTNYDDAVRYWRARYSTRSDCGSQDIVTAVGRIERAKTILTPYVLLRVREDR